LIGIDGAELGLGVTGITDMQELQGIADVCAGI